MRQEINDRIERIKNGQVPEEYVHKLYSTYSLEWSEVSFEDIFEFNGGMSIPRGHLGDEGIAYLHYGDIHKSNNTLINVAKDYNKLPKLNIDIMKVKDGALLQNGDIVFADASEDYEGIGKSVVIYNPTNMPYISGLHTIIAKSKDNIIDDNFKRYLVSDWSTRKQIMILASGISVFGISKSNLSLVNIVLPSLGEQQKIASILSAWDKAIELKELIIEEKNKQKIGLMQKLLTGEVRLPGFDGEWEEVRLSEVAELLHGYQFRKEDFSLSGIPVIKIGNVKGFNLDLSDVTYIDNNRLNEFQNVVIINGDLLMSLTGNIGRVVEVTGLDRPAVQNYRVGKFVPNNDILTKQYLKHILSSKTLFNQFNGLANQSAQANFGKQDMDKLYLEIPTDNKEQLKIAEIIDTSINEIILLTQELEALRLQKKGLMQLLLTGIVRVNTDN